MTTVMACVLCSELDGLLYDPDLIVTHLKTVHDIDVRGDLALPAEAATCTPGATTIVITR